MTPLATIYVTIMRRWGSHDNHSYIAGALTSQEEAVRCGILEWEDRGCGKYEYEVVELPLLEKAVVDLNDRLKKEGRVVASTCDEIEQRIRRFDNGMTITALRLAAKGEDTILRDRIDNEIICPHCGKGVE